MHSVPSQRRDRANHRRESLKSNGRLTKNRKKEAARTGVLLAQGIKPRTARKHRQPPYVPWWSKSGMASCIV